MLPLAIYRFLFYSACTMSPAPTKTGTQAFDRLLALRATDPEVFAMIQGEERREFETIRLIPSENYASRAVMEATGSVLTNKYSEGYPGRRYYEGQEFADKVENLAIARAKALFGVDHINVQPYSGSPANMAVYAALLQPGDTIMGLSLPHGGHLTHGWKVNFSGKLYRSVPYEIDPKTERLNYDAIRELAKRERPKLIVAGFTAYPRIIEWEKFRAICDETGAFLHADISHLAGLVVGGVHPSPFPLADIGITTTHKSLRGPRGAMILCKKEHAQAVDRAIMPGLQGGPHNHTTAAIAVALKEAATPEFRAYAEQIVKNAQALAERLLRHGFHLISGGTDNHLILMEVQKSKGIPGRTLSRALESAGIECNANTVPFDPNPPMNPSGVRLGTPSVTSRGMKEPEMQKIADWIHEVTQHINDPARLTEIKAKIAEFCAAFPCPGIESEERNP